MNLEKAMSDKTTQLPVHSKLASAEQNLQQVLDNPGNDLDKERIRLALALIKFERSKQQDEAKQKTQTERRANRRRRSDQIS